MLYNSLYVLYFRKDLVPVEDCKILVWYEIFKIEKAGSQLNVNEGGQSPTKREYQYQILLPAQLT